MTNKTNKQAETREQKAEIVINELKRKLLKLAFDSVNGETLTNDDGWAFTWSFKLDSRFAVKTGGVQLVWNLRKDGEHVMTWGCTGDDQLFFVELINRMRATAGLADFNAQGLAQEQAQHLFKLL